MDATEVVQGSNLIHPSFDRRHTPCINAGVQVSLDTVRVTDTSTHSRSGWDWKPNLLTTAQRYWKNAAH